MVTINRELKMNINYKYLILLLSLSPFFAQATESVVPFPIKGITNFAREIDGQDVGVINPRWRQILKSEPIIEGKDKPSYNVMKAINQTCNSKPYQASEEWQTPNEFALAKTTDCKGYSVCKYYALRAAGFKAEQLNLWSGAYNNEAHMTLVAELDDKQYVLDAGDEANLPLAQDYFYKKFIPAYRFNEKGWDIQ